MAADLTGPVPAANHLSSSLIDDDYPLIGETLGLWRLLRGIGRGGMGEVYEAEYDFVHLLSLQVPVQERALVRQELEDLPRSEQAVMASDLLGNQMDGAARFAIKVCTARVGTAAHKRFLQEAEWAQQLGDHPYIVTVHSIHAGIAEGEASSLPLNKGPHADVAYMVMELASRRYNVTKSTIKDAVHVVRCVAAALDHAHAAGIIHRDLKPENILGDKHHPLLTDFGIAKELDHGTGLTRTGQIIGTLDYMSPEQATDAKHVDLRTDVYSLGVVLYEFATGGCLPYYHLTERESCLAAIRSQRTEPRWPRQYVPGFPRSLEWIILKAMAHRPDERYQSMSDFIADLDRYSRGNWISFVGRVHPRRLFYYTKKRHPYWLFGIPAAMILALVLWGGFWFIQNGDPDYKLLKKGLIDLKALEIKMTSVPRERQLLSLEEQDMVEAMREVFSREPKEWPDWHREFEKTLSTIERHQWLKLIFQGKYIESSRERLKAATRNEGNNWSMVEEAGRTGLQVNADEEWNMAPFADGQVYALFKGVVYPGFQMHISEAEHPQHQLWIEYQGSRLSLYLQQDEMSPQLLAEKRVPRNGFAMSCGVYASESEVLLIWPGDDKRFEITGLRPGAAARVKLRVPGGMLMELFYIGSKRPL